jgi:formylglycine-generating enzyme required for sulfatase activity
LSVIGVAAVQAFATEPTGANKQMVSVPGGTFQMGAENTYPDAVPVHEVVVGAFYLDRHEVSNRRYAEFVEATGYTTQAEQDGFCWCYIEGADDFQPVKGADWRHPQGPDSDVADIMDHPVVCISWDDAQAYAAWAGQRLPTEAEWEYAARAGTGDHFEAHVAAPSGGHVHHAAGTGDVHAIHGLDKSPSSKSHSTKRASHFEDAEYVKANVWEGTWPELNQLEDGWFYTAEVGSFVANDFGIHDMIGNVWEWTADWYDGDYYVDSPSSNPAGPEIGENRVARGGSWFCSPNYCGAYSTHYRGASPPNHAFNNVGFRCARDVIDE